MRKGWWKPYVSGAVGAGLGIARGVVESGGNPIGLVGAVTHGIAGGKAAYALHENIRNKYSVPWMGRHVKGPGRRSTPKMGKKKSRKRK